MATHPLLHAIIELGAGEGAEDPGSRSSRTSAYARPAGSVAERRVRDFCAEQLRAHGFQVAERTFDFSAWPGRLALPIAGLLLVLGGLVTWLGTRAGRVDLPLIIGSVFLMVAVVGGAFAGEFGPAVFPFDRQTAVNLEATRGVPDVWLVAHLDSKSQTIPMLLRIVAIVVCAVAWTIVLTLWMATFIVRIPGPAFAPFALVATIAALPLSVTFVGAASDGVLDNASGVATVLETVARLSASTPIGVLITSAEELGLAGARAWLADTTSAVAGKPAVAINVDSIDDRGAIRCMLSQDTPTAAFAAAIQEASRATGERVVVRGVLPGIMVDAVAFKDAGWPAVTLSRGGFHSLARIHTSRDTLAHMSGDGIDATADFASRIIGAIIAKGTG